MAHILAKLKGVQFSEVEKTLKNNFLQHAAQGLFLEHLWKNQERNDEILFLFRTLNLDKAKQFMDNMHLLAGRENPGTSLPEMTFLEGK